MHSGSAEDKLQKTERYVWKASYNIWDETKFYIYRSFRTLHLKILYLKENLSQKEITKNNEAFAEVRDFWGLLDLPEKYSCELSAMQGDDFKAV